MTGSFNCCSCAMPVQAGGYAPTYAPAMPPASMPTTPMPNSAFPAAQPVVQGGGGQLDQTMISCVASLASAVAALTQAVTSLVTLMTQMKQGGAMPGGGGAAPAAATQGVGAMGAPTPPTAPGGASGSGGAAGDIPPAEKTDRATIEAFIDRAAKIYGSDAAHLKRVAGKESSYNVTAVNDWDSNARKGVPSKGLFQFIEPTFKSYAAEAKKANPEAWAGMGEPNWMDWRHQALAAAWAFAHGKQSAWTTA